MIESELRYPNWQTPLQEAILEFDREKLAGRIEKAESAISDRLQALPSDMDNQDERQALADGASILRKLKKDKLS